jgi:hypothetical protein
MVNSRAHHPHLFSCLQALREGWQNRASQVGTILVSQELAGKFANADGVEELIGVLVHRILAR